MRTTLSCLFALALAVPGLLLSGCQSIYKPAAVITISAEKAMESFGHYYDAAIEDPAAYGTTRETLIKQRADVSELWEDYRAAMNTSDDIRSDYIIGKATLGDVKAALVAARDNSQALTEFISTIIDL